MIGYSVILIYGELKKYEEMYLRKIDTLNNNIFE